ncbi:hypothetical protein CE91St48_30470 [Emergencia timonensis]|nr:hypothetical protein CE91St48_30470 [Emergencia timonensis]
MGCRNERSKIETGKIKEKQSDERNMAQVQKEQDSHVGTDSSGIRNIDRNLCGFDRTLFRGCHAEFYETAGT